MITFECISRSEVLLAPPKYSLRRTSAMSHGMVVRIVTAYGIELMPLKSTSANRGIGISIRGSKGFFDTHGLIGLCPLCAEYGYADS